MRSVLLLVLVAIASSLDDELTTFTRQLSTESLPSVSSPVVVTRRTVKRDRSTKLVIFGARHGDRNPGTFLRESKGIYGIEGASELTAFGKRQAYALGREIRSFVGNLVSPNYFPSEAVFYTSGANRCQMTLQTTLAGIYPPRSFAVWNLALDWSPIPYTIDDPMLRMFAVACPESDKAYRPITEETLPEMFDALNKSMPLLEVIKENTGWNASLDSAAKVADNINQFLRHNSTLPPWLTEVKHADGSEDLSLYEQLLPFREFPYIQCAKTEKCSHLMSGVWITKLIDLLNDVVNKTEKSPKLLGFISHTEITMSTMSSIGLVIDRVETGAGFVIEVRDSPVWEARILYHEPMRNGDEHIIEKAVYNDELQNLTSTDNWIPVKDLISYMQPKAITNWPSACGLEKTAQAGDIPVDKDQLLVDVLEVVQPAPQNSAFISSLTIPMIIFTIAVSLF